MLGSKWLVALPIVCGLLFSANSAYSAESKQLQAMIVNRISEKTQIVDAVENLAADETIEIDDQRIVAVADRGRRPHFYAVPFVVKGGNEDGCFAQIVGADFTLGQVLKLSDSPKSGDCDAVDSIFLASRAKDSKTYLCFILGFRPSGQDNYVDSSAWSFDARKLEFHNETEVAGLFSGTATAQEARLKLGGKPIVQKAHGKPRGKSITKSTRKSTRKSVRKSNQKSRHR